MTQSTSGARKPRYVLGTFWLVLGVLAIIGGVSGGKASALLVGLAMIGYSVYLYRGGRFGLVVW
jgi:hypothetical protein